MIDDYKVWFMSPVNDQYLMYIQCSVLLIKRDFYEALMTSSEELGLVRISNMLLLSSTCVPIIRSSSCFVWRSHHNSSPSTVMI